MTEYREPLLTGFRNAGGKQMKRAISAGIVMLMVALVAVAQTTPTTAKDAAELTKLLNEFLAGASRNDPAVHDRFWEIGRAHV